MSYLGALIDDAAGSAVPLTELLRKVRVLAHRAKAPELDAWAKQELEGYDGRDALPPYRGPLAAAVFGDFTGYAGSYQRKVPLALSHLPKELRHASLFQNFVVQGVSEIENVIREVEAAGLTEVNVGWSQENVVILNQLIESGKLTLVPMHYIEKIYATLSLWTLSGVLDTVRTRLLELLMELETMSPEPSSGQDPALPPPSTVQNLFHTVVYEGGTAAVGVNAQAIVNAATALPDQIAEAMTAAADGEKSGFLKEAANWVLSAGREIIVDVGAKALNQQLGLPPG